MFAAYAIVTILAIAAGRDRRPVGHQRQRGF